MAWTNAFSFQPSHYHCKSSPSLFRSSPLLERRCSCSREEGGMATSKGSESYEKVDQHAATVRRVNDNRRVAGWKPHPKRGDVKKGIAKDVIHAFTRWTRTWKRARVAPVRDESMAEEVGLGARGRLVLCSE